MAMHSRKLRADLAKRKLQFNSATFFYNTASSERIFSLNKNKGNKKNVEEGGRSEGGHQSKNLSVESSVWKKDQYQTFCPYILCEIKIALLSM
jgi:hypothetical protein